MYKALYIFEIAVKLCLKCTSGKALLTMLFILRHTKTQEYSLLIWAHYHVCPHQGVRLYHYKALAVILFNILQQTFILEIVDDQKSNWDPNDRSEQKGYDYCPTAPMNLGERSRGGE